MMKNVARVFGAIAVLAIAWFTLRERLPSLSEVGVALRAADTRWLLLAALAEFASLGMFARQQRRLLTAFGVHMPLPRSVALAYGRSALAISLPAGSAVSAAYAFRQFRAGGANRAAAGAVMVLSGVLSFAALALLYATGMLTTGVLHVSAAWHAHPALTGLGVLMLLGAIGLLVRHLLRTRRAAPMVEDTPEPEFAHVGPEWSARWPRLAPAVQTLTEALRSWRSVPPRDCGLALGAATGNWLTDLLCLTAAAQAFGLPLDLAQLGLIYLSVQIVRQIPITPGGIGVIEASLLAGLISAGAMEDAAAATVLAYRLLSCWMIIPIGLLAVAVLRRPPRSGGTRPRSRTARPAGRGAHRRRTPHTPRRTPHPRPPTAARV